MNERLSHQEMKRFLLGETPEAAREQIERRLLEAPQETFDELLSVEEDLLDAYARGELATGERAAVEVWLLSTPEALDRLAFARSLAAVADSATGPVPDDRRRPSWPWRNFLAGAWMRPSIVLPAAAAVLCLLAAGLWLTRAPTPGATGRRAAVERPATAGRAAATATVLLALATRGSSAPGTLEVGPEVERVVLHLDLGGEDSYPSFAVRVLDRSGEVAWQGDGLRFEKASWGEGVAAEFPAAKLPAGRYEVTVDGLTAGGERELVGYYELRVVAR